MNETPDSYVDRNGYLSSLCSCAFLSKYFCHSSVPPSVRILKARACTPRNSGMAKSLKAFILASFTDIRTEWVEHSALKKFTWFPVLIESPDHRGTERSGPVYGPHGPLSRLQNLRHEGKQAFSRATAGVPPFREIAKRTDRLLP